jgi:aldehyde dehydrogenase (NAD+)
MTARLPIAKTPKCYVGGAFIRSESARTFPWSEGDFLVQIPQCSRKDLRNAVEAAANAGPGWQKRSGYNRGQILYRLAEMLEARKLEVAQFLPVARGAEVAATIDRIVYYAGWTDKYEQVLGSVNPVASPHFNFTVTEPMGLCGVIAPDAAPLLGLLTLILPIIATGNTVVALASETNPYAAILLGEMLATSDLPGGVVNLLTGFRKEILPTMATHEHIRGISAVCVGNDRKTLRLGAADGIKRVKTIPAETRTDWTHDSHQSLQAIADFVEFKTVWHPIGA